MPPYLNICGDGEQKSEFWAKNMFRPKMSIFIGLKIADSGAINSLVRFDTGASTVCSVSILELVCFVPFRYWS